MDGTLRNIRNLTHRIPSTAIISMDPTPLDQVFSTYEAEGFEVTEWLAKFLADYEGLTVNWPFRGRQSSFSTTVESCLDAPHAIARNVRVFSKRIGVATLPVGAAFSTEDSLLLAENGDFLLASDAGIQWVAHGFEETARALVTGDWDKKFHPIKADGEDLTWLLTKNPEN